MKSEDDDNDKDYIKTSVGRIQGHLVSAPGSEYPVWEYLGIPFAKPPVGELRFSDPEPLDELPQGKYKQIILHNINNKYFESMNTLR